MVPFYHNVRLSRPAFMTLQKQLRFINILTIFSLIVVITLSFTNLTD